MNSRGAKLKWSTYEFSGETNGDDSRTSGSPLRGIGIFTSLGTYGKPEKQNNLAPLALVLRGEGLGVRGISELHLAKRLKAHDCLHFTNSNDTSTEAPHPRPLSPEYRGEGRFESRI
jgi:hypothetical protein